jgi:hypothetical protein
MEQSNFIYSNQVGELSGLLLAETTNIGEILNFAFVPAKVIITGRFQMESHATICYVLS